MSSSLLFQGSQHFSDCFRSAVEDWGVLEIEDMQPAERVGCPTACFPTQDLLSDLPVDLSRQKITEMLPEELFELLKVAVVIQGAGELPLAVLLPMRKKILQGVPMPAEGFTILFRLQRWSRFRAVAKDVPRRKVFICAI
jgi:hypothetical protein